MTLRLVSKCSCSARAYTALYNPVLPGTVPDLTGDGPGPGDAPPSPSPICPELGTLPRPRPRFVGDGDAPPFPGTLPIPIGKLRPRTLTGPRKEFRPAFFNNIAGVGLPTGPSSLCMMA